MRGEGPRSYDAPPSLQVSLSQGMASMLVPLRPSSEALRGRALREHGTNVDVVPHPSLCESEGQSGHSLSLSNLRQLCEIMCKRFHSA